jgi:DNA-binding NtrC family response regulator/tetratricopeptide (TPR) repeat protein
VDSKNQTGRGEVAKPTAVSSHIVLGKTYYWSGAYREAESYAREAAKHSDQGRILLAHVLRRLGKQREAATLLADLADTLADPETRRERTLLEIGLLEDGGKYHECLNLYDTSDIPEIPQEDDVRITTELGICHYRLNNLQEARQRFQIAITVSEQIQWTEGVAGGLLNLALIDRVEGAWRKAENNLLQARKLFARLGCMRGFTLATLNLGLQRLWQGDLTAAEEDLSEAARLASEMGDVPVEASCRMDLGLSLLRLHRTKEARAEMAQGLRLSRRVSSPRRTAISLEYIGELHNDARNWRAASISLSRAKRIANSIAPTGDIVPEILRRQAETYLGMGMIDKAFKVAVDAADLSLKCGDKYEYATALRVSGEALRSMSRESEGQRALSEALVILENLGERFERDRVLTLLQAAVPRPCPDPSTERRGRESARSKDLCRFLIQHGIIGTSRKMQDVMAQILTMASVDLPILIQGDTGTGKELVARAIHAVSAERGSPFVAFNCATCPPDLLDAELFGHVRGAFTGAHANRKGLVRTAERGTLFLDEIGELREESQARILRLLDCGEVRPLGSDQSSQIAVRIVAATHVDLRDRVAKRRFREDLYFRIAGIRIVVPTLRERREDILELVPYFVREARKNPRCRLDGVTDGVLRRMQSYDWPGNVRQLRTEVFRMAGTAVPGSIVDTWDPPESIRGPVVDTVERAEALRILGDRNRLIKFIEECGGHVRTAAMRLGVSRGHVYRVIKRFGGDGDPSCD